jgi:hypothetical protein
LVVGISESRHFVLIDTGASVSVIKPGIAAAEIWTTQTEARGITGGKLKVMGSQLVSLNVGNRDFTHEFLVSPLDAEYSGILGVDILRHMGTRGLEDQHASDREEAISVVRAK